MNKSFPVHMVVNKMASRAVGTLFSKIMGEKRSSQPF